MEIKCSLCEFFGEKKHCHNCAIFNKASSHAPQEIQETLEEFVEFIKNNEDITERYGVGDYKEFNLYTGERAKIVILDFGKDKLSYENAFAKVTMILMPIDGYYPMHHDVYCHGWADCDMRQRMSRVLKLLPPVLQANIKSVDKSTLKEAGVNSPIITSTDKLFLLSEEEIFGVTRHSHFGEGDQYEYFKTPSNRMSLISTWERSPQLDYRSNFCCIYNNNEASQGYVSSQSKNRIAPAFCL